MKKNFVTVYLLFIFLVCFFFSFSSSMGCLCSLVNQGSDSSLLVADVTLMHSDTAPQAAIAMRVKRLNRAIVRDWVVSCWRLGQDRRGVSISGLSQSKGVKVNLTRCSF